MAGPAHKTAQGLAIGDLRLLHEVARTGSITEAAKLLHLAVKTARNKIQALESELGIALLTRSSSGSALTPEGKLILQMAEGIIGRGDRLCEYAANIREGIEGVVSIACYPVHIEQFLAKTIGEFRREYPLVKVDLTRVRNDRRRESGRSLFDELIEGEVDLAMGPQQVQGTEGLEIYTAKIRAVVPFQHDYRNKPEIPIGELVDEDILIAPRGYFSRGKVAAFAHDAGVELHVVAESSSPTALAALSQEGLGVALLPDDYGVVQDETGPYPVVVDRQGEPAETKVSLQWRADMELSKASANFVEVARRVVVELGLE